MDPIEKGRTIPPLPQARRGRIRARKTNALLAVAALVTLGGCSSNFGLPGAASEQAVELAHLWRLFFLTAVGVGGLVAGLILWSALRYRRRSDELPEQTLYNIPLEVTYTVIPLVIVAILFASTMRATSKVNELVPDPDLVVEVTGFQWQWRFNYPDQGVDIVGQTDRPAEMVLPVGSTVRVLLTSTDVIHAFYVPEFGVKRDAIPGRVTPFDVKLTSAGKFDSGRCAEYCGLNHDKMSFTVRAVPRDEFDAWAAGAR